MAAARDSYVLTSPQGSTYDLASWSDLSADGPDFGDSWMSANYTSNPAADGGQLAYESVGVRTMRFPLVVASRIVASLAGNPDLLEAEQLIRQAARPGALLDITVTGDANSQAIRFDVLTGRWKPDYNVRHQAVGLRLGTLELDTQPFGYMPTEILLASVASVGLPGKLDLDTSKLIGDVPGLANFQISMVNPPATNYPAGTWRTDFMAWSLGARPSFQAFWSGASVQSQDIPLGSTVGDKFAPASQAMQFVPSQNLAAWKQAVLLDISQDIEPAYRGRHHLFVWARLGPSQALPWYLSADVAAFAKQALASAAPIATLAPDVASGSPGAYGAQPSPAYTLLDLGMIALPAHGSGATTTPRIRLWLSPATSNVGVASTTFTFGGLYLQPLDAGAGNVARGIVVPTIGATSGFEAPGVRVNAIRQQVTLDTTGQKSDLLANYRGGFPLVGASALRLDLLIGERPIGANATGPLVRSFPETNSGSVSLTIGLASPSCAVSSARRHSS
jgi:hypothetical protein